MAEILKIREITIDTMQHKDFATKEEELKLIRFYQNDLNSAKLLINVTHDKVVTDFSSATSVQIAFLKPDCKRVFQDVQNVNQMQGKYYVVLSTQTLIAYGNVIAQLRFTFPNNKVIETCKFAFTVDKSIMSDDAMKSTNEFPVIQKAIDAGKKLEGVDINGIIAAGELAKGAVKKSGDTMSGTLLMQGSVGFDGDRNIYRRQADGNFDKGFSLTEANVRLNDWKNKKVVWDFDHASETFTVNSNTNLLKTTGGTMTGTVVMEAGDFRFKNAANDVLFRNNTSGIFSFFDIAQNQVIWTYNPTTKEFNINANTNLLKKTGDTITGLMTTTDNFRFKAGGERNITWRDGNDTEYIKLYANSGGNRLGLWSTKNNKAVWEYHGDNDIFNVTANTNLAKKTGDTFTGEVATTSKFSTSGATLINTNNATRTNWILNLANTSGDLVFAPSKTVGGIDWDWTKQVLFTKEGVVKSAKDGRATNIPPTADAELFTANGIISDRRGNTVTLRAPFRKKSGGNTSVMFTMPADMRPTLTVLQNVASLDGVQGLFVVNSNGEVWMQDLGSSSVTGKSFYITVTYVVD